LTVAAIACRLEETKRKAQALREAGKGSIFQKVALITRFDIAELYWRSGKDGGERRLRGALLVQPDDLKCLSLPLQQGPFAWPSSSSPRV
jgi:hypothetical protein